MLYNTWCNTFYNVIRYVPEGNMSSCGTDFLAKDWSSKSYILVYSIFVYYTPLFTIIYSYYFIVSVSTFVCYNIGKNLISVNAFLKQTVAAHEKAMREQAKKMNVQSLRSGENQNISAEAKLAKV